MNFRDKTKVLWLMRGIIDPALSIFALYTLWVLLGWMVALPALAAYLLLVYETEKTIVIVDLGDDDEG